MSGAGSRRAPGGLTGMAGVIRPGRSRARIIAKRTTAADGAWYRQKQVSSSGMRIAPMKRTAPPRWLACPAASAMSAAPGTSRGAVGLGHELGHAPYRRPVRAAANHGNP